MKIRVAKILGIVAIVLFVFGCKKNEGAGKLYLKLKDMSSTTFKNGDVINFEFNFSHPNTEKQNDTLFIKRIFFTCPLAIDTPPKFIIPEFFSTADQLSELTINYNLLAAQGICMNNKTDSCYFFFCLKDKNGNKSDTVKSPKIILLK